MSEFSGQVTHVERAPIQLWLIPLRGPRSGGLLLKQRNPAGDRSVLVRDVLGDRELSGVRRAYWDAEEGALRIPLEQEM